MKGSYASHCCHSMSPFYCLCPPCHSDTFFVFILLYVPPSHPAGPLPQVHSCCHATIVQHAVQLEAPCHSYDLGGLGSVLCHLLPPAVWAKQHRYFCSLLFKKKKSKIAVIISRFPRDAQRAASSCAKFTWVSGFVHKYKKVLRRK